MKQINFLVKSTLSICLLFFSTFLMSTSITSFEITPNDNEKEFLLSIESSGNGSIDIRIKDNKGKLYVSNHFESMNSFEKRISLADLKDGLYTLEIEDEIFRNVQNLSIQGGKLTVEKGSCVKYNRAQFRWHEDSKKLDISWLMNDFFKSKFTILDEESRRVYDFNFADNYVINKRFDLNALPPGLYTFLIKNDQVSFLETIQIN